MVKIGICLVGFSFLAGALVMQLSAEDVSLIATNLAGLLATVVTLGLAYFIVGLSILASILHCVNSVRKAFLG